MKRIDPARVILELAPRVCDKCNLTTWGWFTTPEEYNDWHCKCIYEPVLCSESNWEI